MPTLHTITRLLGLRSPHRHDRIMRAAHGATWNPESQTTRATGLFGRIRRRDWHDHALAAQLRVLAAGPAHPDRIAEPNTAAAEVDVPACPHCLDRYSNAAQCCPAHIYSFISRYQAELWAGRPLTDDELERLAEGIPFSSIPDAIVNGWNH